jgi:hypothetical protein
VSLAAWALIVGSVSLVVSVAALGWQVVSWKLARRTHLKVRFGLVPGWGDDDSAYPVGVEVVNHSDFPVSVQTVQLVFTFGNYPEPLIVGLRAEERATIPGTVQPHDSGFIASGVPRITDDDDPDVVTVYTNVITAVGNVRTPAYDVDDLPPFPAPMRFSHLLPLPAPGESSRET